MKHNHMTRDFKPKGVCPACDARGKELVKQDMLTQLQETNAEDDVLRQRMHGLAVRRGRIYETLRYQGFTVPEIAELVGITRQNVYRSLRVKDEQ